MTPTGIREKTVTEKLAWIRTMQERLRGLPRDSLTIFLSDPRTSAAAESYLRRALEALLDLGRHILAKGFAKAVVEYKQIPRYLLEEGVIAESDAALLRDMAGYRNRMVHFYDEVSPEELYEICTKRLGDIEQVISSIVDWLNSHPDMITHDLDKTDK